MSEFTQDDHDRLVAIDEWKDSVDRRLTGILIAQKRLPARTARRVAAAFRKRDAILIAIGAMVGSSLGTGASGLIMKALTALTGGGH